MPSHPPTYHASTKLSEVGERFLDVIVATIIYNIFYGLLILLFYQSTAIFLQNGLATRNRRFMFLATTITFLLATVYEGCLIARVGPVVRPALSGKEGGVVADKPRRVLRIYVLLGTWASIFEIIISDCIVVWRASVFFQQRKKMIIPSFLLLLASVVMYLVFLISGTAALDYGISDKILAAAIALSLGTNIVSTSLIGYIYWIHRRDVVSCFYRGDRKTRGELVLATLMESGVVFCVFQAIFFALGRFPAQNLRYLYAERVFISLYIGFVTIYPTSVVVLVNKRRTFDQTDFFESLSPPISFHADADIHSG